MKHTHLCEAESLSTLCVGVDSSCREESPSGRFHGLDPLHETAGTQRTGYDLHTHTSWLRSLLGTLHILAFIFWRFAMTHPTHPNYNKWPKNLPFPNEQLLASFGQIIPQLTGLRFDVCPQQKSARNTYTRAHYTQNTQYNIQPQPPLQLIVHTGCRYRSPACKRPSAIYLSHTHTHKILTNFHYISHMFDSLHSACCFHCLSWIARLCSVIRLSPGPDLSTVVKYYKLTYTCCF